MYMFNGILDELGTKRDIHWKPYIQKAQEPGKKRTSLNIVRDVEF